jgi:copper chaperone CopZ
MPTINFRLSGLHCGSCITLATMTLEELPGVIDVKLSGLDGLVELKAEREIPLDEIQTAFEGTEYTVSR